MGYRKLLALCLLVGLQLGNPLQAQTYLAGGTEWRPFSYSDAQGRMQGLAVEITRKVLAQAGIETRFVSYPVNRLQVMLEKGQLDLSFSESPSWSSAADLKRYVFSVPYLTLQEHLYFNADHPAANQPLEQLEQLTIGMVRGYNYRKLDAAFEAQRLRKLETSQDMALLDLLQNHRVDAVAMVDELYDYLVAEHRLDPRHFRKGQQLSEAPLTFMLQKRHAALLPPINAAIAELKRNGEIQRIRDTHLQASRLVACNGYQPRCW